MEKRKPMSKAAFKIVAIVDDFYSPEVLQKAYTDGARVLELRLDLFEGYSLQKALDYFRSLKQLNRFQLLGTFREMPSNAMIRLECFDLLLDIVDMVDIECDTPIKSLVIEKAKKAGKKVMISFHDFEKTPSNADMDRLLEEAKVYKPDIVKLAVMPKNHDDVIRLLNWCYVHQPYPLAVMAMGDIGKFSRVIGSLFGSKLSYGFLGGKPVAPGQMSVEQLKKGLMGVG
jgi:3-dehydroquinate dehydratase-1